MKVLWDMIIANASDVQNCLSCFSIAVIKYQSKATFKSKHLILDLQFQRFRVHGGNQRQGQLRLLICKLKAERRLGME